MKREAGGRRPAGADPIGGVHPDDMHAGDSYAGKRHRGDKIAGIATIALLAVSVLLGGGGASALPPFEAICEFAGFAALAALVLSGDDWTIDRAARPWLMLAALALLLPLAQLVPLPLDLLRDLPGRGLAEQIRALGPSRPSAPLTLDPDGTVIAMLCVIPGIAAFAGTLRASLAWRRRAIFTLVGLGLAALLIGGLQMASGGTAGEIYDTPHRLAATGFFANRNHHSLFMVLVLLLATAVLFDPSRRRDGVLETLRYAVIGALAAGILLASSRAGLILLMLSVPAILVLVRGRRAMRLSRRLVVTAVVALSILCLFLAFNPVARQVIDRFSATEDARAVFWPDVVFSVRQFWPVGTGIGTFQSVFATQERLTTVDEFILNHAHNDFLELAQEGGAIAVVLILVFLGLLGWQLVKLNRRGGALRRLGLAGGLGILLVLTHSTVDYPLRAITATVVFGFLCGLLFAPARFAGSAHARIDHPADPIRPTDTGFSTDPEFPADPAPVAAR